MMAFRQRWRAASLVFVSGFERGPLPTREKSSQAYVEASNGHLQGIATIISGRTRTASELSLSLPKLIRPANQKVSTDSRTRATTVPRGLRTSFGTPAIVFSNRCVQKAACGLSTTWLQNSHICVALLQLARVAVPPGPARVAPLVCAAKERPHTTLCPRTRADDHCRELELATTRPLQAHD